MKSRKSVLDAKFEELKGIVRGSGITQAQIMDEMTDQERKIIEAVGGLSYMQAVMNIAEVPLDGGNTESGNS